MNVAVSMSRQSVSRDLGFIRVFGLSGIGHDAFAANGTVLSMQFGMQTGDSFKPSNYTLT